MMGIPGLAPRKSNYYIEAKIIGLSDFINGRRLLLLRGMRVIILLLFVGALAAAPVYLFDRYAMPRLLSLKDTYDTYSDNGDQLLTDVSQPLR